MTNKNLKSLLSILIVLLIFSCNESKPLKEKKTNRFYFLSNYSLDTNYIDKPSFDTAGLTVVYKRDYSDHRLPYDKGFHGFVYKLSNEPAPIDGGGVYYLTPDLGIIYSNSTTWMSYQRLHSTNDSIECRINLYLEHILFDSELIRAGEIQAIKFTPPLIKEE